MNVEIQSAVIQTNNSHTFKFSKPVKEYVLGFSKCYMEFHRFDHHIKEISIDLTNSILNKNEVFVKPELKMNDDSNHRESEDSYITVVVLATVGDGNPDIHMINEIKKDEVNPIPTSGASSSLKPVLTCTSVHYHDTDHHIYQYFSTVEPVLESNSFSLKGQSVIQDHDGNAGNGIIIGSVIIRNGNNNEILFGDFDSKTIGGNGLVCLGDETKGINYDNYELGCFVNGYELSYGEDVDHHVYKIEISATFSEKKLVVKDGKVYANLNLKSFLADSDKNQFDIPHNNVTGFVIAISKSQE